MPHQKIKQKLKKAKNILIISHKNPDGDAVGSMILFKELAKKINPKVKATSLIDPSCKKELQFFTKKHNFIEKPDNNNYDLIISLDAAVPDRLYPLAANIDINIDHHADNNRFAVLNIVDMKAASVGIILLNIIEKLNIKLNYAMAEGLYLSVYTDTGCFAFSNTNKEVFRAALIAVQAGVNPDKIHNLLFEQDTLEEIKHFGTALANIQSFFNKQVIMGFIPKKSSLDNRVLIDFIRKEKNSRLAIVLVENNDFIKVSLRSKDNIDVSKIARAFNGGGHKKAASGKIMTTNILSAKKTIMRYLKENVFC
jgi:phosphoesterase RecJ-like protein